MPHVCTASQFDIYFSSYAKRLTYAYVYCASRAKKRTQNARTAKYCVTFTFVSCSFSLFFNSVECQTTSFPLKSQLLFLKIFWAERSQQNPRQLFVPVSFSFPDGKGITWKLRLENRAKKVTTQTPNTKRYRHRKQSACRMAEHCVAGVFAHFP